MVYAVEPWTMCKALPQKVFFPSFLPGIDSQIWFYRCIVGADRLSAVAVSPSPKVVVLYGICKGAHVHAVVRILTDCIIANVPFSEGVGPDPALPGSRQNDSSSTCCKEDP